MERRNASFLMVGDNPRFAIYFAPDSAGPLWRFGSACLGYDAELGTGCDLLVPAGWAEPEWRERTHEPRRYGFHATLKAPFHLCEEWRERDLLLAFDAFAAEQRSFVLEGMRVRALSHFIALTPVGETGDVVDLAAACVRAFDRFRAPLSENDLARRLTAPLTERQKAYLAAWGYPYVMEEFRFHMTLTGPLVEQELDRAHRALARMYETAVGNGPVAVDSISLFRQDRRDGRFILIRRAPLRAPRSAAAR